MTQPFRLCCTPQSFTLLCYKVVPGSGPLAMPVGRLPLSLGQGKAKLRRHDNNMSDTGTEGHGSLHIPESPQFAGLSESTWG